MQFRGSNVISQFQYQLTQKFNRYYCLIKLQMELYCTSCNNYLFKTHIRDLSCYFQYCLCRTCSSTPKYVIKKYNLIEYHQYQTLQNILYQTSAQLCKSELQVQKLKQAEYQHQEFTKMYQKFISSNTKKCMELFYNTTNQAQKGLKYLENILDSSYQKCLIQLEKGMIDIFERESRLLKQCVQAQFDNSQLLITKTQNFYKHTSQQVVLLKVQFKSINSDHNKEPQQQLINYAAFEENESSKILSVIQEKLVQLRSRHNRLTTLLGQVSTHMNLISLCKQPLQPQKPPQKSSLFSEDLFKQQDQITNYQLQEENQALDFHKSQSKDQEVCAIKKA